MDRSPNRTTCLIPRPVRPTMPNSIRIRAAIFPQCTGQTDQPTVRTDRQIVHGKVIIDCQALGATQHYQQYADVVQVEFAQYQNYETQLATVNGYASICCDLWPFDRTHNQYVSWPRYICDLILVKLAPTVTKILYSSSFWVIACCDLDPLTPKSNQHICEPKYTPSLVFEIQCLQGFWNVQSHSQTHSQTDTSKNRMPPAQKVFSDGGTKLLIN